MSVPGLDARRAALRLLDAVLRRGSALEAALAAATRGLDKAEDRALAHAIASETLRRLIDLDALIDGATRQRLPDDAKARMVLRIALAQALALGTPHHAVVATALPLVEGGPRKLVHGVLGALLRKGAKLPPSAALPAFVATRWRAAWGDAMLADAQAALAVPPPLDLTLKDATTTAHWATELGGESLAPGHVRVARGAEVTTLPGYAEGAWWVQNLAASIPARLLGEGHGRTVLDLCAAPGGKTMQLAAAGWRVTAVELQPARMERLSANLARTKLTAEPIVADILNWSPAELVDAILLDAPCSATGIFARHPDVLYRVRAADVAALAEQQAAMLARALTWLKPGGRLIYAVCSLEREEGESVAEQSSLPIAPILPEELPPGFVPDALGRARILPRSGCDGFFIARFERALASAAP